MKVNVSIIWVLILQLHRGWYNKCLLQLSLQIFEEFKGNLQKISKRGKLKLSGNYQMISRRIV